MVLARTGVNGSEPTGVEETTNSAVSTTVAVAGGVISAIGRAAQEARKRQRERNLIPPEIKGDFRKDLYEAFVDKGVPKDVASEAADDLMLNKDAKNSTAIATANKIVEESQFKKRANAEEETREGSGQKQTEDEAETPDTAATAQTNEGQKVTPVRPTYTPTQNVDTPAAATTKQEAGTKQATSLQKESVPSEATVTAQPSPIQSASPVQPSRTQAIKTTPAAAATVQREASTTPQTQTEKDSDTSKVATAEASESQYKKPAPPSRVQALKTAPPETATSKGASTTSKNVEIAGPPAKMNYNELQKTVSAISAKTDTKPSGRKKAELVQFVDDYKKAQQEEQSQQDKSQQDKSQKSATVVASPPVTRTPVKKEVSLESEYSAGLKAAEVDDRTAAKAANKLVSGQGANDSAAIKNAHAQVEQKAKPAAQRSALHQLYYDVLAKQGIDSKLAEAASKDLAEGKGALSSHKVREAHKTILDKELINTGAKTPQGRSYQKHGRYVTEREPRKRDQKIAINAAMGGMSTRAIEGMIRLNSPVAGSISREKGGNAAAGYSEHLARGATSVAQKRSKAMGKSAINSKAKSGLEV